MGLRQSCRQIDGFKPLSKTDTAFGCWVRGVGGGWRRWLEGRPKRQGKVVGGFIVGSRGVSGVGPVAGGLGVRWGK